MKFVFDQHDLNPELFRSRFGEPTGLAQKVQYRALLWLEQMTYRTADHVIATNESYAAIARERGALPRRGCHRGPVGPGHLADASGDRRVRSCTTVGGTCSPTWA